ncbi:contact-dependent growth inhibition system immunity protein [Erwinia psidii]|uniref:CdiI immunity protein domain-containing protein n=1 Tax=Erwinia psidii TaxID=69224 RepID=A0A3N6RUE5_9GAMM|nr:contact-dependent growth inhibition system immunity protein [Erwinia psidii]MCX8958739.1 hypothetical protein [Erwinia psidii]MCX8963019.1 hypothetical protein [Erwinia psidii]MCX8967365.1 hypothetical protein [Erwinia psidii]RQM36594.1 hypothetical protein EB241_19395 [Erwinia psidii]
MFPSDDCNELNTLITAYFGQDYDLIDDSEDIERKIDIYIRCSDRPSREDLLNNIDTFLAAEDDPERLFLDYYGFHFSPTLWNTTAVGFLQLVRQKISQSLS